MELDVTALCGFIKEMNNLFSFSLNCLVLSKYLSRVLTGYRVVLLGSKRILLASLVLIVLPELRAKMISR